LLCEDGYVAGREETIIGTLKKAGGYTTILRSCIQDILGFHEDNPRIQKVIETIRQDVEANIPRMRTLVQILVSRLEPSVVAHSRHEGIPSKSREALKPGSHFEVRLRVPRIGWTGIADCILLAKSQCEIMDFKTGAAKEQHADQLRVYALLWARDSELNPDARLADKLTLSYPTHTLEIPAPSMNDLDVLEGALVTRSKAAKNHLKHLPPDARPSRENCSFCEVRHLCNEYWRRESQELLAKEAQEESAYGDFEVVIVSKHTSKSWRGEVLASTVAAPGTSVILGTTYQDRIYKFKSGDSIRVLGARLNLSDKEDSPALISLTSLSEAYLVGPSPTQ
jgi:hypothetical protein